MGIFRFHKVYIPVQTAKEGKVCVLGINVRNGIGHRDLHGIFTGEQCFGQFITESGEAALVGTQLPTVAVNGCHMVCTPDLNILPFSRCGRGQLDPVVADAPPVFLSDVTVVGIPGVGQRDRCKFFTILGKFCVL